ncbi:MAG: hypothetical protein GY754_10805 [bacterium]|nr:hypothetical protein [bacterium]
MLILSIGVSLCVFACCFQLKDNDQLTDFKKEGFLDDNYFQALVTASPEPGKAGFVNKRESAFFKAKESIVSIVPQRLARYSGSAAGNELNKELRDYLSYGYIAHEYYNQDNSVILVYRVRKCGLKKEIESIGGKFKSKSEKK